MGTENILTEWGAYVFVTDLVVIIWQWGPKDGCGSNFLLRLSPPGHQRLPNIVKMAITAYREHILRHSVEERKRRQTRPRPMAAQRSILGLERAHADLEPGLPRSLAEYEPRNDQQAGCFTLKGVEGLWYVIPKKRSIN